VAEPPAYFFDTSALFKRYHAEPGTDAVDAAFAAPSVRIASDLGLIELISSSEDTDMDRHTDRDANRRFFLLTCALASPSSACLKGVLAPFSSGN
jgi:hypothetical protein